MEQTQERTAPTTGMKHTTFEEFVELTRRGTFVPVYKEVMADLFTPVSAFLKIAEHADYAFLLESVEGGEHVARYSFLGKDPFLVLKTENGQAVIEQAGETKPLDEPFVDALRRLASEYRSPFVPDLPRLTGGAVGYFGYDASPWFEPALGGDVGARRRQEEAARGCVGPADRSRRRSGVHVVRYGAGVRSRQASHPDHRERAHHAGRGSGDAVSVRVRAHPVPRARAGADAVAAGTATARQRRRR